MSTDMQRAPAPVRVALAAAIGVVVLNTFTGNPVLALWIASKTNGDGPMKMESILVFLVVMGVITALLYRLLKYLGARYDIASGAPPATRQHLPWNQSLRGDRPTGYDGPRPLTTVERIVCAIVIVVFALFEYWFFFMACSPIDQRCGRNADAVVAPLRIG
ncbi:MAG: hypothetical protein QOG62_1346 [Thermoleophilaceae bacterium]|nr:hypothetical protein [Thermoleophilaceae bacterium]